MASVDVAAEPTVSNPASPDDLAASPDKPHSERIDSLHGLRFFAAFCIVLSHACSWIGNFKDFDGIRLFGEFFSVYGMPLFFVLSGFVIHYNYGKLFTGMRLRWAILEFAGARFARLFPLLAAFTVVGIAVDFMLEWLLNYKIYFFWTLFHQLTLTQSWFYIVLFSDRMLLWNGYGLSWSISTEIFFYLFYIVAAIPLAKIASTRTVIALGIAIAAAAFLILVISQYNEAEIMQFGHSYFHENKAGQEQSFYRWLFYYSPYSRIFEFIMGCLAAQLYLLKAGQASTATEQLRGQYFTWCAAAFLVGFGLAFMGRWGGDAVYRYVYFLKFNFACAVPIAILIFCTARYKTVLTTMLTSSLAVYLGELSYSIYTVHTWTLRIFFRPATEFSYLHATDAVLRIVLGIALTLILSVATYMLIELPARRWLRGVVAGRMKAYFGRRTSNHASLDGGRTGEKVAMLVLAFIGILTACIGYQFNIVPLIYGVAD